MKPMNYSGGSHNNMEEVRKWGESRASGDGTGRRPSRRASKAKKTDRRLLNRRARAVAKAALTKEEEEST